MLKRWVSIIATAAIFAMCLSVGNSIAVKEDTSIELTPGETSLLEPKTVKEDTSIELTPGETSLLEPKTVKQPTIELLPGETSLLTPTTTKQVGIQPKQGAKPSPTPSTEGQPGVPKPTGNITSMSTDDKTEGAVKSPGTNPLVIKGYRFFDSVTGGYFGFKGVNYYPRPNTGKLDVNNLDLFTNDLKKIWGRDVPEFSALNANAIRLYAVDPDGDHEEFMCALQSLGIYVLVDLGSSCKGCEITPDESPACYPASFKTRGEKIISAFSKYDNVIAFSGGNEINHRTRGNPAEWNAPCQKKFIRDMRAYIASCPSMRKIPVGLVVADTQREDNLSYYNCATDPNDKLENAEWYGINVYVHCDDISDPKKATGFNLLRDSFEGYHYSIPTILTEFGCVTPAFPTVDGYEAQRTHHDAKFMNTAPYTDIFAGGFAFEYSTENANSKSTSKFPFKKFGPQNYGLGYLSPENCDDVDTPCEFIRFPNFDFLSEAYKSTDFSKEPTLDSFVIDEKRKGRTKCPTSFPKLKDFEWEGDSIDSISCPKVERLQCPNVELPKPKKVVPKVQDDEEDVEPEPLTDDMGGSSLSASDSASGSFSDVTTDSSAWKSSTQVKYLLIASVIIQTLFILSF